MYVLLLLDVNGLSGWRWRFHCSIKKSFNELTTNQYHRMIDFFCHARLYRTKLRDKKKVEAFNALLIYVLDLLYETGT